MKLAQRLVAAWPWVLSLLVTVPLLAPGYVLIRDMVFVPRQSLRSDYFGLGEGLPRAVPSDAIVSVLTLLVPGQLVQKVVLVLILALAGLGVSRLLPQTPVVVRLAAVSWFVWNPYVAERLGMGQWAVLVGYAALPWVARAAIRLRRGRTSGAGLVLALAWCAVTASGGTVGLVLAALVLAWPGRSCSARQLAWAALGALAVNAPWAVAGLLHADRAISGGAAVEAFSARGEGHLPAPLAVLTLGGMWNAEVMPASRAGVIAVLWTVLLLGVCVAGVLVWRRGGVALPGWPLAVSVALGFLLALASNVAPDVVTRVTQSVPGLALLRDSTRQLGLLALPQALAFGIGAGALSARAREGGARVAIAAGLTLAPLAVMPDLAWGAAGELAPTDYPRDWANARAALVADGRGGDVLVLPLSAYRAPDWNGRTPVLDPATRYFPGNMLASDTLYVDGLPVQDDEPRVDAARAALTSGDGSALQNLGVGFVVVEYLTPDETVKLPGSRTSPDNFASDLGLDRIYSSASIEIFGVSDAQEHMAPTSWVVAVALSWLAAAGAIAFSWAVLGARRRKSAAAAAVVQD